MVAFSTFTSMRVGGEPAELIDATTQQQLVDAARDAWSTGDPWLVVGGGSNLVVADDGFDGTAIRVLSRGIEVLEATAPETTAGTVRVRIQAGEPWDAVVAHAVANGWAGIEALSGIPGSTGAAPVQNIGAYGAELSDRLVAVDFLDYLDGDVQRLTAADLGLAYRTSAIKEGRRGIVLAIELELADLGDGLSAPIGYDQLAGALGVAMGSRVPLDQVRSAVLAVRASKGMVLSDTDPDSVSCGSFFTNPIVGENFARTLPPETPRWPMEPDPTHVAVPLGEAPALPPQRTDHRVKLSAAWLIEQCGITKGYSLPGSGAAISSKHTLSIVNTGSATAADVAELGRYVQTRVFSQYGVQLQPEPVIVGLEF
jgi:UDP-N-acetylmuramate dehydrogenase